MNRLCKFILGCICLDIIGMILCIIFYTIYNDNVRRYAALLVKDPTNLSRMKDIEESDDNKLKTLTAFFVGEIIALILFVAYNVRIDKKRENP
jgi:energy-converting hydrogenase Eha subunit C